MSVSPLCVNKNCPCSVENTLKKCPSKVNWTSVPTHNLDRVKRASKNWREALIFCSYIYVYFFLLNHLRRILKHTHPYFYSFGWGFKPTLLKFNWKSFSSFCKSFKNFKFQISWAPFEVESYKAIGAQIDQTPAYPTLVFLFQT